jgi:hypothetical protein
MVTAIFVFVALAALLVLKGWLVGRAATSDGDYGFAFWWGLAILCVLVAVFLTVLAI